MGPKAAPSLSDWLRSGSHLPKVLRDFHDQKHLFKCLDEAISRQQQAIKNIESWEPSSMPNWMTCHIYTVDYFLWFMARHGYVLRRVGLSRANRPQFDSLSTTLEEFRDKELEELRDFIEQERPAEKGEAEFVEIRLNLPKGVADLLRSQLLADPTIGYEDVIAAGIQLFLEQKNG